MSLYDLEQEMQSNRESKQQWSVRLPTEIIKAIKEEADDRGESHAYVVELAIRYLREGE